MSMRSKSECRNRTPFFLNSHVGNAMFLTATRQSGNSCLQTSRTQSRFPKSIISIFRALHGTEVLSSECDAKHLFLRICGDVGIERLWRK